MSYTEHDFPHTNFYNSDLRELLRFYKELQGMYDKLVRDIEELNAWRVEHQSEYVELLRKIGVIENEIATFEAEVIAKFDALDASIHKEFNDLKIEIREELAEALADFERLFTQLRSEIERDIVNMKLEINSLINYLNDQIANINVNVIKYVDDRLNKFIQDLPDYENLIIYNPVVSKQTNVQQAINDLYNMFNVFGITAAQYDSLQLTASEFDNKQITAHDYDAFAYDILEYPDPNHYMRDPFTGRFAKNKVVIYELTDLHRNALTASEYDALEITAGSYDELNLTAYYFDWYGIDIGTGGIDASEYDSLEIEAEEYDDKRISAYNYDNYGHYLLTE